MHSSNASQTYIFSSQLVKSNRPGHKEPLEKKPLRESPRGNVLQILQSKGIINIALILCGWIPAGEICEINTDYTKHTFLKKMNGTHKKHGTEFTNSNNNNNSNNSNNEFIKISNLTAFC